MSHNCIALTDEQGAVLSQARDVYGNVNQLLVAAEELSELIAVCAKFPRYDDPEKARTELRQKAIDEVADVIVVLDHVINIFQLQDEEILSRIAGKIDRLSRWLGTSNSMEQTTVDRVVHEGAKVPCGGCTGYKNFQAMKPGGQCFNCMKNPYQGFVPKTEGADGVNP